MTYVWATLAISYVLFLASSGHKKMLDEVRKSLEASTQASAANTFMTDKEWEKKYGNSVRRFLRENK